jgi:hypothetical protein
MMNISARQMHFCEVHQSNFFLSGKLPKKRKYAENCIAISGGHKKRPQLGNATYKSQGRGFTAWNRQPQRQQN